MPHYDYRCDGCEHEFELYQSIKASPEKTCPECGEPTLRRLIGTGAAIVFKGSGFYQTDYRSASYKKGADAEKKARTDSKKSADGKKSTDGKKSDSKKKTEKAATS